MGDNDSRPSKRPAVDLPATAEVIRATNGERARIMVVCGMFSKNDKAA
jgi:hypothetical protein